MLLCDAVFLLYIKIGKHSFHSLILLRKLQIVLGQVTQRSGQKIYSEKVTSFAKAPSRAITIEQGRRSVVKGSFGLILCRGAVSCLS